MTMDYKEKWEMALERAKLAIKECGDNKGRISMIESIFPELGESEDERIREAIKYCIKQGFIGCGKIDNVTPDECLAWLEKQGEQNLANSAKTCKNEQNDQTNFTEFEEALADVCRGWVGEEIGWKDYIIRNANALLKICQKMWNEVQDVPFEQKPTWSEEDEKRIDRICDFVWKNRKGDTDEIYQQERDVNWLKSLKHRVQPKQEWSDEDEENLQHCCGAIAAADYYTIEDKEEMIGWLKFKTTNVGNSSITVEGMYNL